MYGTFQQAPALGAYGLPKDPVKARRECLEARAKLAALRAKRGAKGKADNRSIRRLEAKVARLCAWADQMESMTQADQADFSAEIATANAALSQALAFEDVSANPLAASMGAGQNYEAGPGGIPLPVLIIGGLVILGALGGGTYFLTRR